MFESQLSRICALYSKTEDRPWFCEAESNWVNQCGTCPELKPEPEQTHRKGWRQRRRDRKAHSTTSTKFIKGPTTTTTQVTTKTKFVPEHHYVTRWSTNTATPSEVTRWKTATQTITLDPGRETQTVYSTVFKDQQAPPPWTNGGNWLCNADGCIEAPLGTRYPEPRDAVVTLSLTRGDILALLALACAIFMLGSMGRRIRAMRERRQKLENDGNLCRKCTCTTSRQGSGSNVQILQNKTEQDISTGAQEVQADDIDEKSDFDIDIQRNDNAVVPGSLEDLDTDSTGPLARGNAEPSEVDGTGGASDHDVPDIDNGATMEIIRESDTSEADPTPSASETSETLGTDDVREAREYRASVEGYFSGDTSEASGILTPSSEATYPGDVLSDWELD